MKIYTGIENVVKSAKTGACFKYTGWRVEAPRVVHVKFVENILEDGRGGNIFYDFGNIITQQYSAGNQADNNQIHLSSFTKHY